MRLLYTLVIAPIIPSVYVYWCVYVYFFVRVYTLLYDMCILYVGTDATIATHIATILAREYVTKDAQNR